MNKCLLDDIHNLEMKSNEIENLKKMLIEENCQKKNTLDQSKHLNGLSNYQINELENNITNARSSKENEQNINEQARKEDLELQLQVALISRENLK